MKQLVCICLSGLALTALAQLRMTNLSLTVYNQNFAVVRDTVPLDLKAGADTAIISAPTAQVEPDSVILRDPAGQHSLQILEQNYRNDPYPRNCCCRSSKARQLISSGCALKANTETPELVPGKIVRSGFVPGGQNQQPMIEVNGKLAVQPAGRAAVSRPRRRHGAETRLQLAPAIRFARQIRRGNRLRHRRLGLERQLQSGLAGKGDFVDLVGWITMKNESGKTFENARIKLMAGDVNKIQPTAPMPMLGASSHSR